MQETSVQVVNHVRIIVEEAETSVSVTNITQSELLHVMLTYTMISRSLKEVFLLLFRWLKGNFSFFFFTFLPHCITNHATLPYLQMDGTTAILTLFYHKH